jgi:hypothetical protein
LAADRLTFAARLRATALCFVPIVVVAVTHLLTHAAWLRIAATSGAVPRFEPGPLGWLLIVLACAGAAIEWRRSGDGATSWFAAGLGAQALALYALARVSGAQMPYMAMKMLYLAVYPAAVLGAVAIGAIGRRLPASAVWVVMLAVCGIGVMHAGRRVVPPSVVDVDLHDAGRWAREHLPARCVDYIANSSDQAYWLHLAVLGQPRSSRRTAEIDGYTANRAIGRWLEGDALPYAIALRELLPGELLRDVRVLHEVGGAVVIERVGVACPLAMEGRPSIGD